jgi:hypothetical protein
VPIKNLDVDWRLKAILLGMKIVLISHHAMICLQSYQRKIPRPTVCARRSENGGGVVGS